MRTLTFRMGRRYGLHLYQNDVTTWRCSLTNESGDAIDLTGKTIRLNAKLNPFDAAVAWAVSGSIVGDATNGIVDFPFTATHTGSVRGYKAEIEVETTGGAGDIESVVVFDLGVLRDVG